MRMVLYTNVRPKLPKVVTTHPTLTLSFEIPDRLVRAVGTTRGSLFIDNHYITGTWSLHEF
jgi:hypothetical protein